MSRGFIGFGLLIKSTSGRKKKKEVWTEVAFFVLQMDDCGHQSCLAGSGFIADVLRYLGSPEEIAAS